MTNLLIFCLLAGITAYVIGLRSTFTKDELYCEELGYKADLKQWKNYAKTLTASKPMRKELDLMNKDRFMREMYFVYNLTMKEI